jgi:alkyl sulfatase BDS1-like metallo-beta-lactamase superfamily hydrolase
LWHFHYVNGTTALLAEMVADNKTLPIYGHSGIDGNRARYGGEVGPRTTRGLVHQFGILLPTEGADGLENVGLGQFFRNAEHQPFTPGYLPATDQFDTVSSRNIAGLEVIFTPAPSDADDSLTIWFPALQLCVNNLVWPALFNIFAIRGEEYRDPRKLLKGLDHLQALGSEHLLASHGPPVSGRDEIQGIVRDYRDAIQFIWDQTVRGANKGLALDELVAFVQLPKRFNRTYFTQQFYGVVEHHVKQIHAGLFGWFDEDAANLFPLPPATRASRLVAGFGGAEIVRAQVDAAITAKDYRWAVELASWLVRTSTDQQDRNRLASALRQIGQHTTSSNVRNWCLTRCLELEGKLDLARFREHRFRQEEVLAGNPARYVGILRVLLDPLLTTDLADEVRWEFASGEVAGLQIRGAVAIPTDGAGASLVVRLDSPAWAQVLAGKTNVHKLLDAGELDFSGDESRLRRFLGAFDHPGLRLPSAA